MTAAFSISLGSFGTTTSWELGRRFCLIGYEISSARPLSRSANVFHHGRRRVRLLVLAHGIPFAAAVFLLSPLSSHSMSAADGDEKKGREKSLAVVA